MAQIELPQEIEVWYIIPSLRREFARIFKEKFKLKQTEIAQILNITEAAVSQYISSKRAKKVVFDKEFILRIQESCELIVKTKSNFKIELQKIMNTSNIREIVCELHKKVDKCDEPGCKICHYRNR